MAKEEGLHDGLRNAVLEAQVAIVKDVEKLFSALREDLPAELQKAQVPVLDILQELRNDGRTPRAGVRSSASLQLGKDRERLGSGNPPESAEHSRSIDGSEAPRAAQILRRVSAPLNAARAAISANRAAQRLKRGFISPENSEEMDETPARRSRPALSIGGSRPLQVQPQLQASGTSSRIPTFLRLDAESEREEQTMEVVAFENLPIQSIPLPVEDEAPALSPVIPGLPGETSPLDVASPQADLGQAPSSSTSSLDDTEDSESVHSTIRTERRASAVRPMNSLEILPNFYDSEQKLAPAPLCQRVAGALASPFRHWLPTRTRPARDTSPRKSLRSRAGSTNAMEAKVAIKAQGRHVRRKAVVLQASEMEKLTNKARWRRRPWPFRDPSGRPRQGWDMVACWLLLLQLLYLPFQEAFVTDADYQDPVFTALNGTLLAMDVFWVLDLLLNFTTGYRDAMQVLHCDARSIAAHYLRSWFWVDLVATVPPLLLHLLMTDLPSTTREQATGSWQPLRWLGFTPFLRAPRLWQALKLLRRLEVSLKSSLVSSVVALVQLFMLPVVFSHVSACALWSLGRRNLEVDSTTASWIKLGLDISNDPGALQAVPVGERYMTAMYFAITVMSTVGLGDINMNLSNERALLCVIMATTSLVVGVAVNGVATIVSKLSERTAVTNEHLAKVGRFMRVYSVPSDLQSRVHNYLLQFFENQEREETKSMLMTWLKKSEVLRVNVNMALTGTCLATHHLLQLVPREILVNICDICDMEFHPPGQELVLEGVEMKSCFYIRRGLVQTRGRGSSTSKSPRAAPQMTSTKSIPFSGTGDEEDIDEIQKEIEAADAARPDEQFHGGAFIGDFRLFLGTSRSWKTVACVSFCELISIDAEKFRSLMVNQLPELFDMLVIYSAIDHNCPRALLRCLEEQGLSPEVPLLFGEGVLHHCAKKNADTCADHLIEQLGADVTVLDQEEKTPAQLAAALKHKEVFWAVIKHGSIVTDADVLPKEVHSLRNRSKRKVQVMGSLSVEEAAGPRLWAPAELRELLAAGGLNPTLYGHAGHKSLEDLLAELSSCHSELLLGPKRRVRRRVKLVRLRLLAIIDDAVRALVEVQSDAWLRASDQKLGKLPCRRVLRHETVEQATKALLLEVGIPEQLIEEKLVVPVAKSLSNESKVSMGFPGLESEYVVHESSWKVRAAALSKAPEMGLPQGRAFSVDGHVPLRHAPVTRRFFWPVLLNIHLDAKEAEQTRTEDLRVRFEQSDRLTDGSMPMQALARFNPLRALRNGRVVDASVRHA